MKKIIHSAVIAVVLFASGVAAYAEGEAAITRIEGKAVIERGGRVYQAVPGTLLETGDVLKTERKGQVDVAMNGVAGFRLLESSDANLENTAAEDMQLKISKGNIILNLQKLPENTSFSMDTPSAVAAVRGTQFWGRVNAPTPEASVTTLAVREGSVAVTVKSSGETFVLDQGQALDIPLKPAPTAPRQALKAEMAAMAQASDIPTSA